jgi:hypothetical protein
MIDTQDLYPEGRAKKAQQLASQIFELFGDLEQAHLGSEDEQETEEIYQLICWVKSMIVGL